MSKIIPLKANPRDIFARELAKLVSFALQHGGWQMVANDLGQVAGGLVGAFSDKPQRDLDKLAAAIRNTNWRVEKRRMLAARMGVDPSEISEADVAPPEGDDGNDGPSDDGGGATADPLRDGDGPVPAAPPTLHVP